MISLLILNSVDSYSSQTTNNFFTTPPQQNINNVFTTAPQQTNRMRSALDDMDSHPIFEIHRFNDIDSDSDSEDSVETVVMNTFVNPLFRGFNQDNN